MRPVKILHLISSAQLGGAERVLLDIVGNLDPQRYVSSVALPSYGPLVDALCRTPAQVRVIPRLGAIQRLGRYSGGLDYVAAVPQSARYLRGAAIVAAWARSDACDLIHAHGWKAHLLAALLRPLTRARQIWHVHDFASRRAFGRLFALAAYESADLLIAVSSAVARDLPRHLAVEIVHNGTELVPLGSGQDGPVPQEDHVMIIGALAPWKGHEGFLRAVAQVAPEFPSMRAEIVGDEIYATKGHRGMRHSLEMLTTELGLSDRVKFHGWLHDIHPVLRQAAVVVHASIEPEPFGRVLIEAMAAGKPVVAVNAGGVPEIVVDGETGILVPPGNHQQMAAALALLLRQPQRRQTMGHAARLRVAQRFTIDRQVRSIAAIYDRVLAGIPPLHRR